MLMRTDPFRDFDRLAQRMWGTAAGPAAMPMDADHDGERYVVAFDLPGVDPDSIDLQVEHNALTVRAERPAPATDNREYVVVERPAGVFTRQLFLGETLDTDKIEAGYDAGVLTVTIPVAEQAKPRRVSITSGGGRKSINA